MTAVRVWISAVIDRRYSLARRAYRHSIFESRKPERRTISIRPEIEKIIVRIEKFGDVIAHSTAAAAAEVAVGFDTRAVTSSNVIRDEIDNRFQPMRMKAFDQLGKFLQALGWLFRIVRADVEIILDGVGTAGESLQQIGVIRGLAEFGIIGGRSLLQHAREPDVSESHLLD